jgi:hypothetical protein
VNLRTEDGVHHSVKLAAEGRARVRAEIDGGAVLRGRARLLLPRGSKLVVHGTTRVVDLSQGAIGISHSR